MRPQPQRQPHPHSQSHAFGIMSEGLKFFLWVCAGHRECVRALFVCKRVCACIYMCVFTVKGAPLPYPPPESGARYVRKSAAHRDKSREWNDSKEKLNLC